MSLFDEILAKAAEEDRGILLKYPELKASVERAEALATEVNQQKTTMADWNSKLLGWESWKINNWDDAKGMPKAQAQAIDDAAAARRELAELQARGESDMTFDEILAGLQGKGFMTKEDVAKAIADRGGVDKATIDARLEQMDQGISFVYGETAHMPLEHNQEFGKPLRMKELFKFMAENKISDPQMAYDRMVEPLRRAKHEQIEADRVKEVEALKAAHAEELEKIKREAAEAAQAAATLAPLPVESGIGHSGIRLTRPNLEPKADGPQIAANAELGRGDIAAALAAHYRANKGLPVN